MTDQQQIAALIKRVKHLEQVLERIAVSGTHHDPMPTRQLYHPERNAEAFRVDSWWQDYHMSAETQVRRIAREGLQSAP